MKRLLQLGIVLGFAGAVAAAYYFPWVSYARFPSAASVVANGGRGEQFLIRLPADRIDAVGGGSDNLRGGPYPDAVPDGALTVQPSRVEQFKLRDARGNVVGVAARHWTVVGGDTVTAWLLVIPSRGSLALAGMGEPPDAIAAALRNAGWTPGAAFDAELSLDVGGVARSVVATGEFDGISFQVVETWRISGIDDGGELMATIELNTIGTGGS